MNDAMRARIVRGWMLLAVVTVGWLLCPSWFWLLPVALFMPPLGCPCSNCSDSSPSDIQIVVSGVVNGTCSDCNNENGTFVAACFPSLSECAWRTPTFTVCASAIARYTVRLRNIPPDSIEVGDNVTGNGWIKTVSFPISCAFSSENIPRSGSNISCNHTVSTMLITSL